MRSRAYQAALAVAIGCLASPAPCLAQENPEARDFVDSYSSYGEPGERHAELRSRAGEYDVVGRMRFTPDGPWEVFFADVSIEPIMGGRFIAEHIRGEQTESWPDPYEGLRILGFDNLREEYTYVVLNSFGTNLLAMVGPAAEAGARIDLRGTFDNPMTGTPQVWRTEYELASPDRFVLREYPRDHDDQEFLGIEATYTRRSAQAGSAGLAGSAASAGSAVPAGLAGRWRGTLGNGAEAEFVFDGEGGATWTGAYAEGEFRYHLRYWIDRSVAPHRIELFGFPDGPLAGRTMFGIMEIDGDTARLDLEPGPGGSAGDGVRPSAFTESAVTLRRSP